MNCRCAVPAIFIATTLAAAFGSAQNPIQIENAKAGTSGWQLSNPATNREIEGYASLTSVNIGGNINFSVSTSNSSFNIEIFRTGWYGGIGARRLMTVSNVAGVRRSTPSPDAVTGLIDCNWPNSYTLSVPTNWVSGIYLARLTGIQNGKQSYIMFVVRDDNRGYSDIVFESSVTTFQAYNFWPGGVNGKSLYDWAPGGRAWKVSFNRPYVLGYSYDSAQAGVASGVGAGEYLANLQPGPDQGYPIRAAGWEYNMVRWLEKNGYDVTYLTNIDVHENGNLIKWGPHSVFLSVGHNEYWSKPMRDNVENALAGPSGQGISLGFFGSNTLYWQIRLESSPKNGAADRTIVCYKYDAPTNDPRYSSNLATVRWRDPQIGQPETALVGVGYFGDPWQGDIVINRSGHWLLNGSGLRNGDHLAGLSGYEVDGGWNSQNEPLGIDYVNSTPVGPFPDDFDNPPGLPCNTQTCNNDITIYRAPGSGAPVIAVGSFQWNWGLDNYNAGASGSPSLRSAFASGAAQTITANALRCLIDWTCPN